MENGTGGARVCEDGADQCSVFFLILECTSWRCRKHALLKPFCQAGETSLGPDGEEGTFSQSMSGVNSHECCRSRDKLDFKVSGNILI